MYFILRGTKTIGPLSPSRLRAGIQSKSFRTSDKIGTDESGPFVPLASVFREAVAGTWTGPSVRMDPDIGQAYEPEPEPVVELLDDGEDETYAPADAEPPGDGGEFAHAEPDERDYLDDLDPGFGSSVAGSRTANLSEPRSSHRGTRRPEKGLGFALHPKAILRSQVRDYDAPDYPALSIWIRRRASGANTGWYIFQAIILLGLTIAVLVNVNAIANGEYFGGTLGLALGLLIAVLLSVANTAIAVFRVATCELVTVWMRNEENTRPH